MFYLIIAAISFICFLVFSKRGDDTNMILAAICLFGNMILFNIENNYDKLDKIQQQIECKQDNE